MVNGLAQIVEQTGPLGLGHVGADLSGQQSSHMGYFDGVIEHVLTVAGAVTHPAQQLDQLRMQAVDVGLKDGPLALGLDDGVYLALGLLHHLLDAGGMNAAVQNQLLQGKPGDLAADGVKAGDCNGLRRVVDD